MRYMTNLSAGGFGGWGWNDFRALSAGWFDGLAAILALVEESGNWPDLLLASKIVMIPKKKVATPDGQRPLSVFVTYRLQAMGHSPTEPYSGLV